MSSPAVTVGLLQFPLQCTINVPSSLCGALHFPQNGFFLQNSPGTQTILFWWALHVLFMVITFTSLISDEISCAYFVLFMSLILLLVFPPFFPVACLSIWKIFILHHFKDKRWNSAVCTLSNLAEYTGVPSNFVSRAHQGFVSQLKWAVSHRAADNRSVSRQLKMRRGTEKSVLKKKKKRRKSSVIVMTTVTADYPGREEPHGTLECAGPNLLSMATGRWQGTVWQGTAWQQPHEEQGHAVPQPPLPSQALQLCWKLLQSSLAAALPHNRRLQINQRKQ